ncbi:MAG: hypothetical protein ACYTGL_19180 [Planctomycetota bacterium]|jgi:hypothetical protein
MTESSSRTVIFRRIGSGLVVILAGLLLAFSVLIFRGDSVPFSVRLVWSRCLLILAGIVLVAAAWCRHREFTQRLRDFCLEPGSPERLGAFRLVVMTLIVVDVFHSQPHWFTELPDALRVAPTGLEWMMQTPLFDTGVVSAGEWICGIIGLAAAVGFRTTWTVPIATALATWLLALPHFDGKVDHSHHLIWFAMLLSTSRCGDAISVDRWLSRLDTSTVSAEYGWPIKCVWLLIGVAYFFPGFWKVWNCGFDWAAPEQMARQLHAKWIELESFQPVIQIDQYPLLLLISGLWTVCMELGFLPMVLFRRSRIVAASAGFLFHVGTWMLMGIAFTSLQFCYLSFIPDQWFRKLQTLKIEQRPERDSKLTRRLRYSLWGGMLLVFANAWFGIRHHLESWPFACYPTFDYFASVESPRFVVTSTSPEQQNLQVDTHRFLRPMDSSGELRLLARVFSAATAHPPEDAERDAVNQFSGFVRQSCPWIEDDDFLELVLYQVTWSDGHATCKFVRRIDLAR